jgi:hypothetical protein
MKLSNRRVDLVGDVLPPEPGQPGHDLVPWEQAEVEAARRPDSFRPLINIHLPMRAEEDSAYSAVYEKRHSARPISVESDWSVPLLQSITCAVAALLAAAAGALAFGWSWKVPLMAAGVGFAIAWLWRLQIVDALLWQIETITQRDLDGDRHVGKPRPANQPIMVNPYAARTEAARIQKTNTAQAELVDMLSFVTKCANVGTSEKAQGIPPSPSARETYAKKRDTLIALGIGSWKDPERRRLGWILTMTPAQATPILRRHLIDREGAN